MTTQSRVERFDARLAKKEQDTKAIIEAQMKKEVATSSQGYEDSTKEELMKAGSISEAAVVFSHAGMSAFAKMFGNSMESAVENVLKERMDNIMESMTAKVTSVVESKMIEMLEGMTAGMNSFMNNPYPNSINLMEVVAKAHLEETVEEVIEDVSKVEEPTSTTEEPKITSSLLEEVPATVRAEITKKVDNAEFEDFVKMANKSKEANIKATQPGIVAIQKSREVQNAIPDPEYAELVFDATVVDLRALPKSTGRFGVSKADITTIKPYIMGIMKLNPNKNLKSVDILRVLRNEYNIVMNNATIVMQKLIKQEPAIEKVGFGIYRYEEKTFRPTI